MRRVDAANLVLEFCRVLVWPVVIVTVLVVYSSELRDLIKRVSKLGGPGVSAEFATGVAGSDGAPAGTPDVWFDVQETSLRREDCVDRARTALEAGGFRQVVQGPVTYGYTDQFVGAVWCGWREGLVLITVAGPKAQGLQRRYSDLARVFAVGRR